MTSRRRRLSRNLQRQIRMRQARTGERYAVAAQTVRAELVNGRLFLADPAVPHDLVATIRTTGLLPLEPFSPGWDWWCRCLSCGTVLGVQPSRLHFSVMHECRRERKRAPDVLVDLLSVTSMLEVGVEVPPWAPPTS